MTEIFVSDPDIKLISVTDFVQKMMGKAHRSWYYRHINDPGMPQRLYGPPGTNPMLSYEECVAYAKRYRKRHPRTAAAMTDQHEGV